MDSKALLERINQRHAEWERERLAPPEIALFDGVMNLRGYLEGHSEESFEFIELDAGTASVKIPVDHYLAKWIVDHTGRAKKDVHVRFRKQGAQWDGRMESYKLSYSASQGYLELEVFFVHCFAELKSILVWSNPFTPAELQFPRTWAIFGKTRWICAVTLWVNVFRLMSGIWSVPGDPFDKDQWGTIDMSQWDIVVVPVDFVADSSNMAYLWSRFKPYYDVVKRAAQDAQISIVTYRYYDGDPIPKGLGFKPKHGALVVDFVDNSGWRTETSFFGNILTGLERAYIAIASDGLTENVEVVTGNPTFPDEYYEPGWRGTRPSAPHVVIQDDRESGIISSEFEYYPASTYRHVVGGRSMPGVNEAMSATVITLGNFLGGLITLPGTGVGLSGLGAAIDAVAKPIYTDTVMAFQYWEAPGRKTDFGPFGPKETLGGDVQAYTLGAFAAGRASIFTTRERTGHKIEMSDAAPYRIGPEGYGDIWLGTRVAVRPPGLAKDHKLYVEQCQKISWESKDGKGGWSMEIGYKEPSDPLLAMLEYVRDIGAMVTELGG